jgi:hypothetical protein
MVRNSGAQRKRNVHCWKPVPEGWWRESRSRRLSACSSEVQNVKNSDSVTVVIMSCKSPIYPVCKSHTNYIATISCLSWENTHSAYNLLDFTILRNDLYKSQSFLKNNINFNSYYLFFIKSTKYYFNKCFFSSSDFQNILNKFSTSFIWLCQIWQL